MSTVCCVIESFQTEQNWCSGSMEKKMTKKTEMKIGRLECVCVEELYLK